MKSIRTKFTFLMVCEITIVVSIVTAIAIFSVRALGNRNAKQMLYMLCETGEKNLNIYFDSVEQSLSTVATLIDADLDENPDEPLEVHVERMRSVFEKVIYQTSGVLTYYYRIDPKYSQETKGFWYTNLDGNGFVEHEVTDITLYDTEDTSELVWFTVPKKTGKGVWMHPYITDNLDVRVISYNVPVYRGSDFVGVIGIEIDYSLMSSEVDNITLLKNGYAFICDWEGNLIYHPDLDVPTLTETTKPEAPDGLLTKDRYFTYTYNGKEKLGVWLPLDNGMRFNVAVPVSEINEVWQKTVSRILTVAILLIIIVGVINMRLSLRLTKPLEELTQATEKVDNGDYDIELSYDGDDEVGVLTRTFSNLVSNLQAEIFALAESEQANKAKTAFLSNMSHEIRTPITTILGMNEIIGRESKDKSILRYCENIRKAGNNLLGIINDILDFSKIEAGKMELIIAPYSLSELICDLYNMVHIRAEEKGLDLKVNIDPKLPEGLIGDELRIKQVITNLLTNAIKYTERGTVSLTMSLDKMKNDTAFIYIAVSDTGIGIRPGEMDKLFSTFDRLDAKRNYTIEGTGLGLSICRRLLQMMGSEISVKSTYNAGSVFSFHVKQVISNPETIEGFDVETLASDARIRRDRFSFIAPVSHIMIVDDTQTNLEVIAGLLKPTEIKIDIAHSGAECIDKFSENDYDLVFLDYRMPQMDGIETLTALKEKEPEKAKATPIISLTANAISGERERMIEAGFTDYLAKPVNIPEMDKILLKYLPMNDVIPMEDEENEEELDPFEGLPKEAFAYSWLDPKEGSEYCGSAQMYLKAIEFYASTVDEKSELIKKCVEEGDIEHYTITVHALKSTSLSIGMESFSKRAKRLELAGKNEDIETIQRDTEDFLSFYQQVKTGLETILEKAKELQEEK